MQNVGQAALDIVPQFGADFDRELERGSSKAMLAAGTTGGQQFGDAAGRSAGSRFGRVFATAAKAALVGIAATGALAVRVGKDSVEQASILGESINAVNVTYEDQAKAVKKLGRESADSLGLSNSAFNSLAVQFSAFSKTVGGDKKVVQTLDDLTTRGADFASVMNLEVNDALSLFQSGLAGESEPLRKFGIDLSAAAVEAHALAEGLVEPTKNTLEISKAQLDATQAQRDYNQAVKEHGERSLEAQRAALDLKDAENGVKEATKGAVGELTEAEKVQARYSLLMQQTAKTQGDFANTSDSLANRQRILSARWDDARAKLGKGLLPIIEDTTGFVIDHGIPAFERFSDWFTDTGMPAIGNLKDELSPLVKELLPAMGDGLQVARDMLSDAVPFAKDVVETFNNLPEGVKKGLLVGGGLYAGSKLLGGGGGGGGGVPSLGPGGLVVATKGAVVDKTGQMLADRLLAKFQRPLPVVVTNWAMMRDGPDTDVPDGKGKTPLLAAGAAATTAAAIAGVSTLGIHKLSSVAAPDQTATGNWGSPQGMGAGLANAEGDLLDFSRGVKEEVDKAAAHTTSTARNALAEVAAAFTQADLPAALKTDIALNGLPEAKADVRALIREYDLTPRRKETLFELFGFDRTMERLERIKAEINWITQPHEARISITKAYAQAGYETRGGLQEGGGTVTTQRRRALGGYGP